MKNKSKITKSLVVLSLFLAFVFSFLTACNASHTLTAPTNFNFEERNSIIKWDSVSNALKYEVQLSNEDPALTESPTIETIEVNETSYVLRNAGIWYVRVRAKGNETLLKSSSYTEWKKCINVIKLTTLTQTSAKVENKVAFITFEQDKNAKHYDFKVYKSGKLLKDGEFRVNNDGAETFRISFDVAELGDYSIQYIMKGDGVYTFASVENTIVVSLKLPMPVTKEVNIDKNLEGEVLIYYNCLYFGVVETLLNDIAIDSTWTKANGQNGYVISLPRETVLNLPLGKSYIKLNSAYGETIIVLNVIDSRKISATITEYSVARKTQNNLDISFINFENGINRVSFIRSNGYEILDTDKYVFDIDSGVLTVFSQLFSCEVGEYSLDIAFDNGEIVRIRLIVLKEGMPQLSSTYYWYDKNGATTNKNLTFKISNIGNVDLTFVNDDYSKDDTKLSEEIIKTYDSKQFCWNIEIKANYLNSLENRIYDFAIFTSSGQLSFYVTISDNAPVVSNVRLDIDTYFNEMYLYWDSPIAGAKYEVSYDGSIYIVSEQKIAVNVLTVGELNKTVTIKIVGSAKAENFTLSTDKPYIVGDTDYTKYTYEFGGKTSNYYITSFAEMVDFFEFFIFSVVKDGKLVSFMNENGAYFELNANVVVNISIAPNAYWATTINDFVAAAIMKARANLENLRNGIALTPKNVGGNIVGVSYYYSNNINNFKPTKATTQAVEQPSTVTPPCYIGYVPTRKDDYTFEIDNNPLTQVVNNSSQLYYAVENGYKPLPLVGSEAERIYNEARNTMRNLVDDTMSDYTKVHYIYDWIITVTTYDTAIAKSSIKGDALFQYYAFYLEGVFNKNKVAVCDGLSKAFVLMCSIEGIDSYRASGDAGGNHAWNKAYIDGKWFGFDVTWGDKGAGILSHDYAFCTETILDEKHNELEYYIDSNGNKSIKNKYKVATGIYDVYASSSTMAYIYATSHDMLVDAFKSMNKGMYYTIVSTLSISSVDKILGYGYSFSFRYARYTSNGTTVIHCNRS